MRFKIFLSEGIIQDIFDSGLEKIGIDTFKNIKAECGQFLNESKCNPLYRGMSKTSKYKINTANTSKPRDSSSFLTGIINLYLEEKFGLPGMRTKNRIYANGKISSVEIYATYARGLEGAVHWVFPTDNYNYVWSPVIFDATKNLDGNFFDIAFDMEKNLKMSYGAAIDNIQDFGHILNDKRGNIDLDVALKIKEYNKIRKAMIRFLDKQKFVNTNLVAGIKSNNEIVIQTKQYYALPLSAFYGNNLPPQKQVDKLYKALLEKINAL